MWSQGAHRLHSVSLRFICAERASNLHKAIFVILTGYCLATAVLHRISSTRNENMFTGRDKARSGREVRVAWVRDEAPQHCRKPLLCLEDLRPRPRTSSIFTLCCDRRSGRRHSDSEKILTRSTSLLGVLVGSSSSRKRSCSLWRERCQNR